RLGLDRLGGGDQPAERYPVWHHRLADRLQRAVRGGGGGAAGDDEVHHLPERRGGERAGGVCAACGGGQPLGAAGDRGRRVDGDAVVAAGVPVRADAHLVCDVARPAAAGDLFAGASALQDAALVELDRG